MGHINQFYAFCVGYLASIESIPPRYPGYLASIDKGYSEEYPEKILEEDRYYYNIGYEVGVFFGGFL